LEQILKELSDAIVNCDREAAAAAARKAVEAGIEPTIALERGLSAGMQEVGNKYETGEYFLSHLMMAGDAMNAALQILKIESRALEMARRGTVVIGTVRGDIHTIGKDIIASLLRAKGFVVHDLGVDVPASRFLETAEETGADIIAVSALMTTTLPAQKELIGLLEERGVRGEYVVLIGGGATTKQWCEEIAADGWAENAPEGVKLAMELLEKRRT